MEDFLKNVYDEAEKLAGRPVEVVQTNDGKYIVEWLSFSDSPPPKADCPADALDGFIKHMRSLKALPDDQVPVIERDY